MQGKQKDKKYRETEFQNFLLLRLGDFSRDSASLNPKSAIHNPQLIISKLIAEYRW